jgi:hypothetical protein
MEICMAEETDNISNMKVIGIGVVIFVVIVGVWVFFIK